jgi:hypothetical protein
MRSKEKAFAMKRTAVSILAVFTLLVGATAARAQQTPAPSIPVTGDVGLGTIGSCENQTLALVG